MFSVDNLVYQIEQGCFNVSLPSVLTSKYDGEDLRKEGGKKTSTENEPIRVNNNIVIVEEWQLSPKEQEKCSDFRQKDFA